MNSAPFSAIITVGALVFPEVILGMIEASMTLITIPKHGEAKLLSREMKSIISMNTRAMKAITVW